MHSILARAVNLPAAALTAPEWIMYMPAGEHEINASQDGKPATLKVTVDAAAAAAVQASLEKHLAAGGPPPFFGFDHVDGRASAWPQEFKWEDGKGIMARVLWTPDGVAAVTVKDASQLPAYRFFSPGFTVSKAGSKITGIWNAEAGSLVNNPAFRAIARITAAEPLKPVSAPADPHQNQANQASMQTQAIADAVVKAGLLTAEEAAGPTAGALIIERVTNHASIKASQSSLSSELASVKARAEQAEGELTTLRKSNAEAVVQAHLNRLPAQDKEGQQWWIDQIAQPGDAGVKAAARLKALPVIVPKDSGATNPGGSATPNAADENGESAAVKARAAQVRAKALELQRDQPRLTFADAMSRAEASIPPAA